MPGDVCEFTKEAIQKYLDVCITRARQIRDSSDEKSDKYWAAVGAIDAFQSVRNSVIGSLLGTHDGTQVIHDVDISSKSDTPQPPWMGDKCRVESLIDDEGVNLAVIETELNMVEASFWINHYRKSPFGMWRIESVLSGPGQAFETHYSRYRFVVDRK